MLSRQREQQADRQKRPERQGRPACHVSPASCMIPAAASAVSVAISQQHGSPAMPIHIPAAARKFDISCCALVFWQFQNKAVDSQKMSNSSPPREYGTGMPDSPCCLLIATLTALAAAGIMQLPARHDTRTSLPFGPFLAIGLLLALAAQQFLGVA